MIFHHIEKSLEHDENDYEVRRISSAISLMQKKYEESEEHGKIAYSMNPNDPRVLAVYGEILVRIGQIDKGLYLFMISRAEFLRKICDGDMISFSGHIGRT